MSFSDEIRHAPHGEDRFRPIDGNRCQPTEWAVAGWINNDLRKIGPYNCGRDHGGG
jgi:hypothetical protein